MARARTFDTRDARGHRPRIDDCGRPVVRERLLHPRIESRQIFPVALEDFKAVTTERLRLQRE